MIRKGTWGKTIYNENKFQYIYISLHYIILYYLFLSIIFAKVKII